MATGFGRGGRFLGISLLSALVGAGCGGDDSPAGDGGTTVRRGQTLLVSTSDSRGVVRVGAKVDEMASVLLVDAETQKPISGALAEALEEDEGDGYLVRVSKDQSGYRPEVVRCKRGQPHTVTMGSSTIDVRGRAVRVSHRVIQDDYVGEFDLAGVNTTAERESRPEILFVPALDASAMAPSTRFSVYKSQMPQILFALKVEGGAQKVGPTVVKGQARVVSTSGARRGRSRVQPLQLATAGEKRGNEELTVPTVSALTVSAPDSNGAGLLSWTVDDPGGRLVAFDVGIDTTQPVRRLSKDVRSLPFEVRRGDHLACVRPVFAGADVDPSIQCVPFAAPEAPRAPSVRVGVKPMSVTTMATARRGLPVVVEVKNDGDVDAPGFAVDVVVSRDGRVEGGLGEVRTLWIDGIKAKGSTTRTTDVTPPRDGELFVVARADALRTLDDANPEDNLERTPVTVMSASGNRAPQVSVAGTAVGGGSATSLMEGDSLKLQASADDFEEGDLSSQITWHSSRDGQVGQGGALDASRLTPGLHRLRAEVSDRGAPAARYIGWGAVAAFETAGVETSLAELEIQVLSRTAPVDNTPPRLSAGPDLTTTAGGEVTPGATASDADGDPLTYAWFVTTEDGQPVDLSGGGELRPRFSPPAAGLYRMVVTASDGKATEKDELLLTVLSPELNRPPRVSVQIPDRAAVGMVVRSEVQASDEDGDGLTLSYALGRPQGSAALLANAETRNPTFQPDVAGVYSFTVRADDGRGGLGMASRTVVVEPGAPPPPPMDGPTIPPTDGPAPTPVDAGVPDGPTPVADGGTRVDAPPPPDGPPPPDVPPPDWTPEGGCDPLDKGSCPAGQSCRVRFPGDTTVCTDTGTIALKGTCRSDLDCGSLLQCVNSICLPICDVRRTTCMADLPECKLPEGNRYYGVCYSSATQPADAGVGEPGGWVDSCDPVGQVGCVRQEEACYVDPGGGYQCLLPGTLAEGSACSQPNQCMRGAGCFWDNGLNLCRLYCNPQQPSCPTHVPVCQILPRSSWGICLPYRPPTADAGGTTAACDPVRQAGCSRTEDACFVFEQGERSCLLSGSGVPDQSQCAVHSDCQRGSGCFDGPAGRICRPYCDVGEPVCKLIGSYCKQLGPGPYGFCQAGTAAAQQ